MHFLEFEQPIAELEGKIEELRHLSGGGLNIAEEVSRLEQKLEKQIRQTYSRLTPAQKVAVARHPERPHCLEYIAGMIEDFTPLAGDRQFAEDAAMISGLGRLRGINCVILGQEKGHDTETRLRHNFGMAKPEGYRKAQRLMRLAERFGLPIVTLVDTSGAFPGVEAEARGQAEAIAASIATCLAVKVPIVSVIIGEGGSGGAIAIATADQVLMLEHSIYSVISPEGCASILWRSPAQTAEAAAALKITAEDLKSLGLIDAVIPEPLGGAHRRKLETITSVADKIAEQLQMLLALDTETLIRRRQDKYLAMGRAH